MVFCFLAIFELSFSQNYHPCGVSDGYYPKTVINGQFPDRRAEQRFADFAREAGTLRRVGANFVGRSLHDKMSASWPSSNLPVAAHLKEIPKTVFSKMLARNRWRPGRTTQGSPVDDFMRQPGKDTLSSAACRARNQVAGKPRERSGERFQSLLQIVAILGLVLMLSTILHKGMVDISALVRIHSGGTFWQALGRYLFNNLAGG